MSTFSQIVDELAVELLRPDLISTISEYLNQTIRELHARRQTGNPVLYDANRLEAEVLIATLPATWPIPSVPKFQTLETVYFQERGVYADKRHPSRAFQNGLNNDDPYWYRSGSSIIFNGILEGETVKLSYFEFPARLQYYAVAARPATYNFESESYTYLTAYDVDDTTRETARNLVTNWLLLRWSSVLKEGVRAKVFKRLGEKDRAGMCFSAFEAQREGLLSSETFDNL